MNITHTQIPVRDLIQDYNDNQEDGVIGYGGRLNIRPAYQREFVYKDAQRDAVINTVMKGFPLNTMYWALNPDEFAPEDRSRAGFEVLDGQQRTLSICKYIYGEFAINDKYFHNLTKDQQDQLLNYALTIYVCEGSDSEKLDWFRTINIAGAQLTDQELLNAVYTGPWLSSAKSYFSKTNCAAQQLGSDYVKGDPIRQDLLELALNWISKDSPSSYMAKHQHDHNAVELWNYYSNVINWVAATFTEVRKEMKSVNWGELYHAHQDDKLDPAKLEKRISELMLDEEVTRKAGIYPYVLNGNERYLSLRAFSEKIKREAYTKQGGLCADAACPDKSRKLKLDEMEADHLDPWHAGGKSILSNCRMLCKHCNRRKGGI